MIVGVPSGFTSAMLLPATSPRTAAKAPASSRHARAGAPSKPEGPGVSRSRFRKVTDAGVSMTVRSVWQAVGVLGSSRGDGTAVDGPACCYLHRDDRIPTGVSPTL